MILYLTAIGNAIRTNIHLHADQKTYISYHFCNFSKKFFIFDMKGFTSSEIFCFSLIHDVAFNKIQLFGWVFNPLSANVLHISS